MAYNIPYHPQLVDGICMFCGKKGTESYGLGYERCVECDCDEWKAYYKLYHECRNELATVSRPAVLRIELARMNKELAKGLRECQILESEIDEMREELECERVINEV